MKRDKKFVGEILGILRDSPRASMSINDIEKAVGDTTMPPDTLKYHLRIMQDVGLVAVSGLKVTLTWKGHDIADQHDSSDSLAIWAKLGS